MSNVPMPEPVGFIKPFSLSVIKGLSDQGRLYMDIQRCADDEFTAPLITTTQAQAYADAVRRETLEEAANICWEMQSKPEFGKDDKDRWLAIAEQRIRALFPKLPGEAHEI